MPRPRPLKNQEEIDAVPRDEPVEVDLTPEPEKSDGEEINGHVVVAAEPPEPEPEPQKPPENPLQREFDALKAAERTNNEAREAAERRAREAEEEAARLRVGTVESDLSAVTNAMAAASAEADSAEAAIAKAMEENDFKALAAAQRRLARAEQATARLEDAKGEIEARREEITKAPPKPDPARMTLDQRIEAIPNLMATEKDWLRAHPDAMQDGELYARLNAAAGYALQVERLRRGSPEYFDFLEQKLGFKQPPAREPEPENEPDPQPQPRARTMTTSAPPSRDVPSARTGHTESTKVRLTPEEVEAAQISGVPLKDYALQKQRLAKFKQQGHYREGR